MDHQRHDLDILGPLPGAAPEALGPKALNLFAVMSPDPRRFGILTAGVSRDRIWRDRDGPPRQALLGFGPFLDLGSKTRNLEFRRCGAGASFDT